jgi:hypothetical protein
VVLSGKNIVRILALFLAGCIFFISLPPSLYHDLLEDHTLEHDFGCITHHADMGTHFEEKDNICLLSDDVYEIQTLVFLLFLSFVPLVQNRCFTLLSENLIVNTLLCNNGRAPPFI